MNAKKGPESPRVIVLGVGNVLLKDEGVGVHVVRALEKLDLPESVRAIDGGTGGFNLIGIVAEADRLIVIDTLATDGEPGSIFRFTPEDVKQPNSDMRTSMHDVGLIDALELAAMSGYEPETTIFGIVPAEIDWGMELTAAVAAAVPKVVELVLQEISEL